MKIHTVLFCAGLLVSTSLAAEIYKCTDAGGNVSYRDRPCTGKSVIITPRAGPKEDEDTGARKKKTKQLLRAYDEEKSRKQQQAAEVKAEKVERRKKCAQARNNYAMARRSGRMYTYDAEGKRTYFSDAERDTAIANEKRAIEIWCN